MTSRILVSRIPSLQRLSQNSRCSFHKQPSLSISTHYMHTKTSITCSPLSSPYWSMPASCQQHQCQQHYHDNTCRRVKTTRRPHTQQVRHFGRKAGHKTFHKTRPPTSKQRKEYNRKQRAVFMEKNKHSPPGSIATERKKAAEIVWNNALQYQDGGMNKEMLESYSKYDAMLDDLIGNTAHLTSTPTPVLRSVSSKYDLYLERIVAKTHPQAAHQRADNDDDDMNHPIETTSTCSTTTVSNNARAVPTDTEICNLIRAHRDGFDVHENNNNGQSRRRRIGLHKSLEHILQYVPAKYFGYKTYSTLITTAKNGKEARRVLKLMLDNGYTPNEYCFSALVDVYADLGDFEACLSVLQDMKRDPFYLTPTLALYTSLLKGCHKVVNNASMPQSVKARAGDVGWEAWKEMRVNGIDSDVMAYGAVIRLCAARGQPEKCMNLIEEMNMFDINPTSLIFTAALQAVARSHRNALRFEGGKSRKNMRRKIISHHHGNMARQIVILAENAEVEQDDGFITALMLCAAAQGDSATAKAISIASDIRRMDHLRTIGSDDHLKSLQPIDADQMDSSKLLVVDGNETSDSVVVKEAMEDAVAVDTESEALSKKDTRRLSALLFAFSSAMESGGLGDLWGGDWNKGFLCEETLFRLKQRQVPKYRDNSVPGVSGTDLGLSGMSYDDEAEEERKGKRLKMKKFEGFKEVDGVGYTLDDIDEDMYEMYKNDDKTYQDKLEFLERRELAKERREQMNDDEDDAENVAENRFGDWAEDSNHEFDLGDMTKAFDVSDQDDESQDYAGKYSVQNEERLQMHDDESQDYAGKYSVQNEERLQMQGENLNETGRESKIHEEMTSNDDVGFEDFLQELKEEMAESGESMDNVNIDEARMVYDTFVKGTNGQNNAESSGGFSGVDVDKMLISMQNSGETIEDNILLQPMDESLSCGTTSSKEVSGEDFSSYAPMDSNNHALEYDNVDDGDSNSELDIFEASLPPALPKYRVEKVKRAFSDVLAEPSLTTLVPIVRENLPDYLPLHWLKRKNVRDARFAIMKADEEGMVNMHVLNSMLEVETKAGSIDRALAFHNDQYELSGMEPTQRSDRLVLEMLVQKRRISRALAFKDKIESDGRNLDLLSYGSLISHYANHNQLGSALMTLKECFAVHGYPPAEQSLKRIRLMCRKLEIVDEVGLEAMVGPDPLFWLRDGEKNKKREMSRRGRRGVQGVRNAVVRI